MTSLGYTLTDRLHVPGVSGRKPLDSNQNTRTPSNVAKVIYPSGIDLGFSDLEHRANVANGLHSVKSLIAIPGSSASVTSGPGLTLQMRRFTLQLHTGI
jgi:hypothetical protein